MLLVSGRDAPEKRIQQHRNVLEAAKANGVQKIVCNLVGEPITQAELAKLINQVYHTNLSYRPVSVVAYEQDRKAALGEFIGTIIADIYAGIRNGAYDIESDFARATGRLHQSPLEMMRAIKNSI